MHLTNAASLLIALSLATSLFSSCKTTPRGWIDSTPAEPSVQLMPPAASNVATSPDSPSLFQPKVEALTTPSAGGGIMLFVYAQQTAAEIDILTAQGWFPLPYSYAAQSPGWTTIRSTYASQEWAEGQRVKVLLKFSDGSSVETSAPIEHR